MSTNSTPIKTHTIKKNESSQKKSNYIKIKVVNQNANQVMFRVKKSIQMKKLMRSFAQRTNVNLKELRFFYDGVRIKERDTPESLRMANNDMIDLFSKQDGGSLD